MLGLNPCPYCGGEVELVKLNKKKPKDPDLYRVECLHCRALTAKGKGFENERPKLEEQRIDQYKQIMKEYLYGKEEEK